MLPRKSLLLLLVALTLLAAPVHAQQSNLTKTVTVTVINEKTGRPVNEAEVTLRKVFLGPKVKTTDAYGVVTFEVVPTGAVINVDVKGSFLSGLRAQSTSLRVSDQNAYTLSLSLKKEDKIVKVRVAEDEVNTPISGASVVLDGAVDMKTSSSITDGSGMVSFDVSLLDSKKSMALKISKPGYKPYKGMVEVNNETDSYLINASLKKDETAKTLRVSVVDEKNAPIVDASVTADLSLLDLSREVTDQSGIANLLLKSSGNFKVSVVHSNFEPADKQIAISKYSSDEVYTLAFQLKRKKSALRALTVTAYDQSTKKPIAGAMISVGTSAKLSGSNGTAKFEGVLTLGETGTITAVAPNYDERRINYIGGGDAYRYVSPNEDEVGIGLRKTATDVTLTIQVVDDETQRPVGNASVAVKSLSSGQLAFPSGLTGPKGEKTFKFKTAVNDNGTLRAMASASGYEPRWSDITPDFLQSSFEEKYFTIFLKKKKGIAQAEEKKFGPFPAGLTNWMSTGVHLKKGGSFRVQASGRITYNEEGTNATKEMSPAGHGYWTWFVLKAKIGTRLMDVGTEGGGYADEEGTIELGAPRTGTFYPEDAKGKSGTWTVYIFSKDAEQLTVATAPAEKINKSKEQLGFLKEVLGGDKIPNKTPEQVGTEVKAIVTDNNLQDVKKNYNFDEGIKNIQQYHEYFYNRVGQPSSNEIKKYQSFLSSMINELQVKIETKRL
jgi:hypothetical protein